MVLDNDFHTPNRPSGISKVNVPFITTTTSKDVIFCRWRKRYKSRVFKNRAPYLFLDEIGKMSPRDQTFLLNLMRDRDGKRNEIRKSKTSVFATCNVPR